MQARLILSTFFALVIVETSVEAGPPVTRKWTDRTGKFSVEAQYVDTKQDNVVLRKASGSTINVPLARLSDVDREYLKTLAKPKAKSADNRGARPNLTFPDAVTEPPSWNDGKTPFDMAEFLRAPPPEENAAPLYLEALYEFAPREMIDLLYPDLPQEEQKRHWDSHRPLSKETWRLEEAWEKDPKSVDGKDVDAWLTNFDVGFQKLAAAQQRPKCIFQPGRSFHSLWPHNQACRAVGRAVVWRTRRDLERGDLERPLADLKMLLRLSRDQRVSGGMVAQLVGDALDSRCCELATMILNAPNINSRQCDRLLALLAEHQANAVDAFVEGNRAEFITSRQALHDMQHRTGSFDSQTLKEEFDFRGDMNSPLVCIKVFTDLGGFNPEKLAKATARLQAALLPGAWQGGKLLSNENYAKEVEAVNRFFTTVLTVAEQPNFPHKSEADLKAAKALVDETTLATFVVPPEQSVFESIRRNDARLRGTQCLVALKRWQLEHADAPTDLATIVTTAGMPGVPLDPYSGEPLRLAVIDGKPVIYSIGPDGKDDQAQLDAGLTSSQPGDLIFRLGGKL